MLFCSSTFECARSHKVYSSKNLYQKVETTAKSEIMMIGDILSKEEDHLINIHAVREGVV